MPSITAVELSGDTCALAKTVVGKRDVRLSALEFLDPRAFPGADGLAAALRRSRGVLKLPRRARVVLWGLPDGSGRSDPGRPAAAAAADRRGLPGRESRVSLQCAGGTCPGPGAAPRRGDLLARRQPQRRGHRRGPAGTAGLLAFLHLGFVDRFDWQPGPTAPALFARRLPRARSAARDGRGAGARHAGTVARHLRQSS